MGDVITIEPHIFHPHQRINHVHVEEGGVSLHWHPHGQEGDPGVKVPMDILSKIVDLMYWNKPGQVEGYGQGNIQRATVQVGAITFEHPGGQEVVSTDSLWKLVAVLEASREWQRRKSMASHNARRVSKHVERLQG